MTLMKTAQELYEDTVAYENLRNSFAVMIAQYKKLEEKICDQNLEIEKLNRRLNAAHNTIKELSAAKNET